MNSWEQLDYNDCVRASMLTTEKWFALSTTKEDLEGEEEEVDLEGDNTSERHGATDDVSEEVKQQQILALIERKFYYAGGSARLFFDYSMDELFGEKGALKEIEDRMETKDWSSFASLDISVNSANDTESW